MQSGQPTLEPHSLCYTCWVQVVYSHLPPLLFSSCSFWDTLLLLSSCWREGVHPELPGVWGPLGVRLLVDVPVAPCSVSDESYRLCIMLPHTMYQTFVINVINNIRTRFIISFTWYVLWYIVHSVVYTCDLILARIWLLGLCPFINVFYIPCNQ